MNVNTGELYKFDTLEEQEKLIKKMGEMWENVELVPEEHVKEGMQELGDNNYAKVDMTKNTPLVNWAKKKRKNKIAKKSRRMNRK